VWGENQKLARHESEILAKSDGGGISLRFCFPAVRLNLPPDNGTKTV
jgi:hypothetical protein